MPIVTLTIDGKEIQAEEGTTVLEAAKQIGVEIPHYCYHPGLSIAGNCRMCLVEVEKAPKPMIGCNTFVQAGMVVKTNTENVVKIRKSVMEFLLINHPLDCPTCDQAGECRLQDYYMQYDEVPSRFDEHKVEKEKMVNLGANVMLDQERCVACTRCVRFCNEIAKTDELGLSYRGDHVEITTFPGKPLSNPYAGNVVDICPVGALTNKDFRYKKRVWFLKKTPSICPGCSRGCNIDVHQADSKVYRLTPRLNPEVNQYWMCDEGRFGYKFINEKRWLRPHIRKNGELTEVTFEDVNQELARRISLLPKAGLALVAHAGLSCEELEAIKEFARHNQATVYYSRFEPSNPFSDDYLITADKNPNQKAIDALGFKPLSELKNETHVLVWLGLSSNDQKILEQKKVQLLGLFLTNETPLTLTAETILPIPTYAEQSGHFINVQGKKQAFAAAMAIRGDARKVSDILADLNLQLNPPRAAASAN